MHVSNMVLLALGDQSLCPYIPMIDRYLASIVEIDEQDRDVCVHFEGWSHRHDEWVEFDTDRLRPLTPTTAQQFQPDIWVRHGLTDHTKHPYFLAC